jgi:hypothetical protein
LAEWESECSLETEIGGVVEKKVLVLSKMTLISLIGGHGRNGGALRLLMIVLLRILAAATIGTKHCEQSFDGNALGAKICWLG